MARTRRALAVPSSRGWRLSTASRKFWVLHRLNVILSLRRIRDPSARRDEVRILRLRSQARFAQDDTALRDSGRPGRGLTGVAKREDSYGRIGGRPAGSRASSPGEQAAACDCQRTRALGRGLNSRPQLATAKELVRWAGEQAAGPKRLHFNFAC